MDNTEATEVVETTVHTDQITVNAIVRTIALSIIALAVTHTGDYLITRVKKSRAAKKTNVVEATATEA